MDNEDEESSINDEDSDDLGTLQNYAESYRHSEPEPETFTQNGGDRDAQPERGEERSRLFDQLAARDENYVEAAELAQNTANQIRQRYLASAQIRSNSFATSDISPHKLIEWTANHPIFRVAVKVCLL